MPRLLRLRSSRLLILTTVCAATFTDGFIYAVIVPVLPFVLHDRYHIPDSRVQAWTSFLLGIFGVVTLAGSPIIGWAADGRGLRRPTWTLGLLSLTASIAMLVASTELWVLVLSRILQGISGAVVYTVGLALVADTVDSQDIGYYMGFALSAMSLGVLVGPFLGGMVFKLAGFYAVVSMMGVTALVDVVLRLVIVEGPIGNKFLKVGKGNDTEHARLLQAVSREIEGPLTTAPALTIQNSQTFRLLLNPRVLAAIYGVFVHIGILASFDAVLALFLEDVFGWTSLEVGVCFLAIAIPCTVLGPLAGKLSDHYGSRLPAFAGFILTAVPMILFQLITHNSLAQIWLLYILLALSGSTLGLIISPLAADLFYVVEHMEKAVPGSSCVAYAQSYSLFTSAMAGGTLAGPILAGWLKAQYGWTVMTWALGAFSASGAIIVYFYTGRDDDRENEANKDDDNDNNNGNS